MHARLPFSDRFGPGRWAVALALAVLAGPAPVSAQPEAGKAQPDRLAFGPVRTSAIVEGSIRIFADGETPKGLEVKVEPPAFIKVLEQKLGSQTYGKAGTRVFCDLALSVDTSRAGNYGSVLQVRLGKRRVVVPVSAEVRPHKGDLCRVLVVETPFQKFSTSDGDTFTAWVSLVNRARLNVSYLLVRGKGPVLRNLDLTKFDVVLLAESGLYRMLDKDVARLRRFAEQGGRVILSANYFFRGTVPQANKLLEPYGLLMTDTEQGGLNEFDLRGTDIIADPLTKGVQRLNFFRPSPVAVKDMKKGRLLVAAPPYAGQGFVAAARAGKGEVVALGTSLWWLWLSRDAKHGSDNARLLEHLLRRPRR